MGAQRQKIWVLATQKLQKYSIWEEILKLSRSFPNYYNLFKGLTTTFAADCIQHDSAVRALFIPTMKYSCVIITSTDPRDLLVCEFMSL